jgi:ribonuclease E
MPAPPPPVKSPVKEQGQANRNRGNKRGRDQAQTQAPAQNQEPRANRSPRGPGRNVKRNLEPVAPPVETTELIAAEPVKEAVVAPVFETEITAPIGEQKKRFNGKGNRRGPNPGTHSGYKPEGNGKRRVEESVSMEERSEAKPATPNLCP